LLVTGISAHYYIQRRSTGHDKWGARIIPTARGGVEHIGAHRRTPRVLINDGHGIDQPKRACYPVGLRCDEVPELI
jgi:hypothetical protein